jgi:hypothetical protein
LNGIRPNPITDARFVPSADPRRSGVQCMT